MLSIGWVMFWKAVVVAVWVAIVERWQSARRKSRAAGVKLRLDPKTGTYVEHCPYARTELWLRRACWIVGVPLAIYAAVIVYAFVQLATG